MKPIKIGRKGQIGKMKEEKVKPENRRGCLKEGKGEHLGRRKRNGGEGDRGDLRRRGGGDIGGSGEWMTGWIRGEEGTFRHRSLSSSSFDRLLPSSAAGQ
jgi:hypothetical protein